MLVSGLRPRSRARAQARAAGVRPSCAAAASPRLPGGIGTGTSHKLTVGQHGAPRPDVVQQRLRVLRAQRPDVDAVDGGHRRDVARAQALEGAHVELGILAGGALDRLEQRVGPAQRAGDVGAHVDAVPAHGRRLEHVVEGRHRRQVGRGEAHHRGHLVERLRRAPAVQALGGASAGSTAERRSG